jgi:hypothetical protein
MASVSDNFPEVRAVIEGLASAWDLRGPGRFKSLGDDARDVIAQGIIDRTVLQQLQPDGQPLHPLAESTIARKERRGYPTIISVEEGDMMSLDEVRGVGGMERYSMSIIYGTTGENQQKAEWFQEGTATQPPRPFFDLDDRIGGEIDTLFEDVLERRIGELGGR